MASEEARQQKDLPGTSSEVRRYPRCGWGYAMGSSLEAPVHPYLSSEKQVQWEAICRRDICSIFEIKKKASKKLSQLVKSP